MATIREMIRRANADGYTDKEVDAKPGGILYLQPFFSCQIIRGRVPDLTGKGI